VLTNKGRIGIDLLVNKISLRHGLKSMNSKLFKNSNPGTLPMSNQRQSITPHRGGGGGGR